MNMSDKFNGAVARVTGLLRPSHAGLGVIHMPQSGPRGSGPALNYQITDTDALWAARMIIGEGHDDTLEVLETMMNRFGFLYGTAGQRDTFTKLLQDYSQPINPRWLAGGVFCRPGGKGRGRDACAPHRLNRRVRMQSASLDDLRGMGSRERAAVDLAMRWLKGEVQSNKVIGAVHFAAPSVVRGTPENMIVHKGGNWFHADLRGNRTRNWTRDTIKVIPSGPPVATASLTIPALVAVLVGAFTARKILA